MYIGKSTIYFNYEKQFCGKHSCSLQLSYPGA